MRLAIGRTNVIRPRYENHIKASGFAILSIATFYFAFHFKPRQYDNILTFGRGYCIIEFPITIAS